MRHGHVQHREHQKKYRDTTNTESSEKEMEKNLMTIDMACNMHTSSKMVCIFFSHDINICSSNNAGESTVKRKSVLANLTN